MPETLESLDGEPLIERSKQEPYSSVTSIVQSASKMAERLSAIRATVDQEMGNSTVYGTDTDIVAELDEIIEEVRAIHTQFVTDHIEARFRRLEEKG